MWVIKLFFFGMLKWVKEVQHKKVIFNIYIVIETCNVIETYNACLACPISFDEDTTHQNI